MYTVAFSNENNSITLFTNLHSQTKGHHQTPQELVPLMMNHNLILCQGLLYPQKRQYHPVQDHLYSKAKG